MNVPAAVIAVFQIPGTNALDVANKIKATMDDLATRFPRDMVYEVSLDTTLPVTEGIVERGSGDLDGRRKPAVLTAEGLAFEARTAERLRALLARAYRTGGLDGVGGARRILAALAGPRTGVGLRREES